MYILKICFIIRRDPSNCGIGGHHLINLVCIWFCFKENSFICSLKINLLSFIVPIFPWQNFHLRGCKGKMKWCIGWNLSILGVDRDPWEFYLMFLSREIYIKLCQIYTKIHIYTILYSLVGLNRSYSANTQPIWKQGYPRES